MTWKIAMKNMHKDNKILPEFSLIFVAFNGIMTLVLTFYVETNL